MLQKGNRLVPISASSKFWLKLSDPKPCQRFRNHDAWEGELPLPPQCGQDLKLARSTWAGRVCICLSTTFSVSVECCMAWITSLDLLTLPGGVIPLSVRWLNILSSRIIIMCTASILADHSTSWKIYKCMIDFLLQICLWRGRFFLWFFSFLSPRY